MTKGIPTLSLSLSRIWILMIFTILFNDIHTLPTDPISKPSPPEQQRINLVWPNCRSLNSWMTCQCFIVFRTSKHQRSYNMHTMLEQIMYHISGAHTYYTIRIVYLCTTLLYYICLLSIMFYYSLFIMLWRILTVLKTQVEVEQKQWTELCYNGLIYCWYHSLTFLCCPCIQIAVSFTPTWFRVNLPSLFLKVHALRPRHRVSRNSKTRFAHEHIWLLE